MGVTWLAKIVPRESHLFIAKRCYRGNAITIYQDNVV